MPRAGSISLKSTDAHVLDGGTQGSCQSHVIIEIFRLNSGFDNLFTKADDIILTRGTERFVIDAPDPRRPPQCGAIPYWKPRLSGDLRKTATDYSGNSFPGSL